MSRALDQQTHFFSMEVSAAKMALSLRHFRRLVEAAGVVPHVFGKDSGSKEKFFLDQKQLDQIQRYRDGNEATVVDDSTPTVRCPLFEVPIIQTECQRQSRKVETNEETCCTRGCPSPWRFCIHCLRQGVSGEDSVVVDPIKGTCAFHRDSGIRARRGESVSTKPQVEIPAPSLVPTGEYVVVPAKSIRPLKGQPRSYFDPAEMKLLEKSILKYGQLQPGLVRKLHGDAFHDYELVDGQRRWHVAMSLGTPYKAVTIAIKDYADQYEKSIASNFQRADHTPMETARAIDYLLTHGGRSQADVSTLTGRSLTWVAQHHRLMNLAPELQILIEPVTPERERIPFILAAQLALLKHPEQLERWTEFKKKGITASAAVLQIKEKMVAGGQISYRRLEPKTEYNRLLDFFIRTERDSRHIEARMNPEEMARIMENRSHEDVLGTLDCIDNNIELLTKLRGRIVEAEKKPSTVSQSE